MGGGGGGRGGVGGLQSVQMVRSGCLVFPGRGMERVAREQTFLYVWEEGSLQAVQMNAISTM